MKNWASQPWFLWLLRLILAGVFIYAGVLKIAAPQEFADSIAAYQFLPNSLINLLTLSLPLLEIGLGVLLLIGIQRRAVSFAILLLLMVFLIALAQALLRGLHIDCGCFGASHHPSPWQSWLSFGRDVLLAIAVWWLYYQTSSEIRKKQYGFYF